MGGERRRQGCLRSSG